MMSHFYFLVVMAIATQCFADLDDRVRQESLWTGFSPTRHDDRRLDSSRIQADRRYGADARRMLGSDDVISHSRDVERLGMNDRRNPQSVERFTNPVEGRMRFSDTRQRVGDTERVVYGLDRRINLENQLRDLLAERQERRNANVYGSVRHDVRDSARDNRFVDERMSSRRQISGCPSDQASRAEDIVYGRSVNAPSGDRRERSVERFGDRSGFQRDERVASSERLGRFAERSQERDRFARREERLSGFDETRVARERNQRESQHFRSDETRHLNKRNVRSKRSVDGERNAFFSRSRSDQRDANERRLGSTVRGLDKANSERVAGRRDFRADERRLSTSFRNARDMRLDSERSIGSNEQRVGEVRQNARDSRSERIDLERVDSSRDFRADGRRVEVRDSERFRHAENRREDGRTELRLEKSFRDENRERRVDSRQREERLDGKNLRVFSDLRSDGKASVPNSVRREDRREDKVVRETGERHLIEKRDATRQVETEIAAKDHQYTVDGLIRAFRDKQNQDRFSGNINDARIDKTEQGTADWLRSVLVLGLTAWTTFSALAPNNKIACE